MSTILPSNPQEYTAVALVIYEALSRIIKTKKTWSIIGLILKALNSVSGALDNLKK